MELCCYNYVNSEGEINMAEHIKHKKEQKKAPQKNAKEKRKEKKQNKDKSITIPTP
jgi:hypothetical protein